MNSLPRCLLSATVLMLVLATIASCAGAPAYDGFETAHEACYSYIYAENGVDIDYAKALQWCSEGAEKGVPSSMTLLAELHFNGHGTPKDVARAAEIYEQAAEADHVHAQTMVFIIYLVEMPESSTCEQKLRGLVFLEMAARSGYDKAADMLAAFYALPPDSDPIEQCLPRVASAVSLPSG